MVTLTNKPKRRWQFSMRILFVFVTLVCVCLGTLINQIVAPKLRHYSYQDKWWKVNGVVNQDASCPEEVTMLSLWYKHLTNRTLAQLNKLYSEIGNLRNLKSLSIFGWPSKTPPCEIWQLKKLTLLEIVENQFNTLPPEIGNLTNLVELDLRENQLTTLPDEIGKLTDLTRLTLFDNQLATLPDKIGELTNLTSLSLGNNQLATLPDKIGELTNLASLGLDNNQLTSLPNEIGKLANLETLVLDENPLTDTSLEHLKPLKKLTSLWLHGTLVTKEGVESLKQSLPNCKIVSDF